MVNNLQSSGNEIFASSLQIAANQNHLPWCRQSLQAAVFHFDIWAWGISVRHSHMQVNKWEGGWFKVLMLSSVCSSYLSHLVGMNAVFYSRSIQTSMLTSTCRSVQITPWRKASKGQFKFLIRLLSIKPYDSHDLSQIISFKIKNLDLTSLQARKKLICTTTNNMIGFFSNTRSIFFYCQLLLRQFTSHQTLKYSPKSAFFHISTPWVIESMELLDLEMT